jgi:hypothetical protein
MPTGEVQISIIDSGASVVVPQNKVQLVMGCCSSGTASQIIATTSPATLTQNLGYGPLVEAASLTCLAGGIVLAVKVPTVTAGTVSGVVQTYTSSTTTITVSGVPYDDSYWVVKSVQTGVIGTYSALANQVQIQISADAGRNFSATITLGTATAYAIPNTGLTLNFSNSSTFAAGDYVKFYSAAPVWNTAGVQAALQAYQQSQYAIAQVGSMHLVGPCGGATASTLETYMDTLATGYLFGRLIVSARDAGAPTAYNGTGEAEQSWMSSISNDYASVSARRICANAAYWNMPTGIVNPVLGAPAYRRSLAWSLAARQVTIPPQRHAGRVRDGSLPQIAINASADPLDGFIYHDERINPGLDAARFCTSVTRIGKQGVFIKNPNLMSPSGSQFTLLPLGNVMDIACSIVHQGGEDYIDDDVRTNPNGTIYTNDAQAIQAQIGADLQVQMVGTGEIVAASVVVNPTWNVASTSIVQMTVNITAKSYVLEEDISIQLASPTAG